MNLVYQGPEAHLVAGASREMSDQGEDWAGVDTQESRDGEVCRGLKVMQGPISRDPQELKGLQVPRVSLSWDSQVPKEKMESKDPQGHLDLLVSRARLDHQVCVTAVEAVKEFPSKQGTKKILIMAMSPKWISARKEAPVRYDDGRVFEMTMVPLELNDLKQRLKSLTEEVWCVEPVTDWKRSCPGSIKRKDLSIFP